MKVIIVIRQLNNETDPVVSAVIKCKDFTPYNKDTVDNYLKERAKVHIEEFKKKFVEFRKAKFFVYINELEE